MFAAVFAAEIRAIHWESDIINVHHFNWQRALAKTEKNIALEISVLVYFMLKTIDKQAVITDVTVGYVYCMAYSCSLLNDVKFQSSQKL